MTHWITQWTSTPNSSRRTTTMCGRSGVAGMAVEASHQPVGEPLLKIHGASIKLSGLTKAFGDTVAVEDLDLEIGSGEFFALLGPSGCGKTTTMRMIAGFEAPTRGEILIDGEDASSLRPA